MLTYIPHEKINLKHHPGFNEAWLHDRIAENPAVLGLGDVRVIDRERASGAAGRLDMLLFDEDNGRRYEVEIMLGQTDQGHIIRTIEYWDVERRRYPAYEHVAVIVAEDITTRFLNVMALLSGSIPIVAVQLDALRVGEHVVLNFVQVLDQTDLRVDDTAEDSGGGQVDRGFWDQRAGRALMEICDQVLAVVREASGQPTEFNYLRWYIGLRTNGVVRNSVTMSPKPTKGVIQLHFRNIDGASWKERLEEAGIAVQSKHKRRMRATLGADDFTKHRELICQAVREAAGGAEE